MIKFKVTVDSAVGTVSAASHLRRLVAVDVGDDELLAVDILGRFL